MTRCFGSELCAGGWVLEWGDRASRCEALRCLGVSDLNVFGSRAALERQAQQGLKLFEGSLTKAGWGLKLGMWLLAAQLDLENFIVYGFWRTAVAIDIYPFEGLKLTDIVPC